MATFDIQLEMHKTLRAEPPEVTVRMGDVGTQTIRAHLLMDGLDYTPEQVHRVGLKGVTSSGEKVNQYTGASLNGSVVEVTLGAQAVSTAGRWVLAYIVVEHTDGSVESTEDIAIVAKRSSGMTESEAQPYRDELTLLMDAWQSFSEGAEQAEEDRADAWASLTGSVTSAVSSATEAAASARSASASATSAASSATNAAGSATTAAGSANNATTAANEAAQAASDAASDARNAAEEARGAVDPDMRIYLTYDEVGDTQYISLVDMED